MSMPYDVKSLWHPKDDELREWIKSVWPDKPGNIGPCMHFKAKDEKDWDEYVADVKGYVLYYLEHGYKEKKPFYFPTLNFVPIY